MITNKKTFLKQVHKDFPEFCNDAAIIDDAEEQLGRRGYGEVDLTSCRPHGSFHKRVVITYNFYQLKNGRWRWYS